MVFKQPATKTRRPKDAQRQLLVRLGVLETWWQSWSRLMDKPRPAC